MPDWVNAQLFQWIANNGFAVVFSVLLLALIVVPILALLRYVIFDAVRYFTTRLDGMADHQAEAFDRQSDALNRMSEVFSGSIDRQNAALDRQTEALNLLREQAARNNEAISVALMFISHTQQEVVAHRTAVEGGADVPSPPMTSTEAPPRA